MLDLQLTQAEATDLLLMGPITDTRWIKREEIIEMTEYVILWILPRYIA